MPGPPLPGAPSRPGVVLVHGDYGPNNTLLDPAARQVTAVLDWEWAHAGDAVEDLAQRSEHGGELSRRWRERLAITASWTE